MAMPTETGLLRCSSFDYRFGDQIAEDSGDDDQGYGDRRIAHLFLGQANPMGEVMDLGRMVTYSVWVKPKRMENTRAMRRLVRTPAAVPIGSL